MESETGISEHSPRSGRWSPLTPNYSPEQSPSPTIMERLVTLDWQPEEPLEESLEIPPLTRQTCVPPVDCGPISCQIPSQFSSFVENPDRVVATHVLEDQEYTGEEEGEEEEEAEQAKDEENEGEKQQKKKRQRKAKDDEYFRKIESRTYSEVAVMYTRSGRRVVPPKRIVVHFESDEDKHGEICEYQCGIGEAKSIVEEEEELSDADDVDAQEERLAAEKDRETKKDREFVCKASDDEEEEKEEDGEFVPEEDDEEEDDEEEDEDEEDEDTCDDDNDDNSDNSEHTDDDETTDNTDSTETEEEQENVVATTDEEVVDEDEDDDLTEGTDYDDVSGTPQAADEVFSDMDSP